MYAAAAHRARFTQKMGEGVALFCSGAEQRRNADSVFRFRPTSDFYYLTGFDEPDAILLLAPQHPTEKVVLFVRPRDPIQEVWTGFRAGTEGAVARFGADAAYPISTFFQKIGDYLTNTERLYVELGYNPEFDRQLIARLRSLRQTKRSPVYYPSQLVDPSPILHEQRLHKSPEEVEIMRQAAAISADAHRQAMAFTRPGREEREIEALLDYSFRARGAVGPSYPTIVGCGINATVLHYTENRSRLEDGQLLLVDAGAELGYYAADITRTWPVNGKFSPAQLELYGLVLKAQEAAVDAVRPGIRLDDIHQLTVRILTEGLLALGILQGSLEECLAQESYRPYYMHRTSHWLGLDVHDAGEYMQDGQSRVLAPGMVLTVEPGLYFGPDCDAPAAYRGIGIRIEDDVLVTPEGHEVLTSLAPKQPAELEALIGQATAAPVPFLSVPPRAP